MSSYIMNLIYPAYFCPYRQNKGGYTVEVSDLPACVSEGDSLTDSILMATDAVSGWALGGLEDGKDVPKVSPIESLRSKPGDFVNILVLDMDAYTENMIKSGSKKSYKSRMAQYFCRKEPYQFFAGASEFSNHHLSVTTKSLNVCFSSFS